MATYTVTYTTGEVWTVDARTEAQAVREAARRQEREGFTGRDVASVTAQVWS